MLKIKKIMGYDSKEYYDGHLMCYYCPKCGVELYGHFIYDGYLSEDDEAKIKKDIEIICKGIDELRQLEICPCCGKRLEKNNRGYFAEFDGYLLEPLLKDEESYNYAIFREYLKRIKTGGENVYYYTTGRYTLSKYLFLPEPSQFDLFKLDTFKDAKDLHDYLKEEFYFFNYNEYSIENCFKKMAKWRLEAYNLQSNNKISEISRPMPFTGFEEKKNAIVSDLDRLKQYVLNLINIESNIIAQTEYLKELYKLAPDIYYNTKESIISDFERIYPIKDEYDAKINDLSEFLKNPRNSGLVKFPMKPILNMPKKPNAPEYKTPGLFNKKRVATENEEIRKNYEASCRKYEEDSQRLKEEYQNAINTYENECALIIEAKKNEISRIADEKKAEFEKSKQKIEIAFEAETQATVFWDMHKKEMEEAEGTLKKLCECRDKLYAFNVVFEKYRSIVVLTTFYEYLISGRCETLEGAHGAYNIYEEEIKMNRIVDKIDEVANSLEQIKSNQFMMYSELKKINDNVEKLNKTMSETLQVVKNIKSNTETISENIAVVAHNTAVAAHYAKVNAELTNALGFMIALN